VVNGLFSERTWVKWYQKGKPSLDLNEARDSGVCGWQWHQLDHMQTICTALQTDNHTNPSSLSFYRPVVEGEYKGLVYNPDSNSSGISCYWWMKEGLHCFDTVGWATGRASGL